MQRIFRKIGEECFTGKRFLGGYFVILYSVQGQFQPFLSGGRSRERREPKFLAPPPAKIRKI